MAGTRLEIDHNTPEILEAFNRLLQQTDDLSAAMAEITSYMELSTRENFDNEQTPDGIPWAPLSETTLAMRADKGVPVDKILHQSLSLRDQIHSSYDKTSAEISTGQPASAYAAMQFFGGTTSPESMIPNVEIPARPYMGFGEDDKDYIVEVLGDFLVNI